MKPRLRFRLRTLLTLVAACALIAAGIRAWYNARLAEFKRQAQTASDLQSSGLVAGWSYAGPEWFKLDRKLKDQPHFRRLTQLWCDEVEDLEQVAARLAEFDQITRLHLLARQIVPRAQGAAAGKPDPLLAALSTHPSLRELIVDASIRGAPIEATTPPYTDEDLALVKQLLPGLDIIWLRAN